MTIEFEDKSDIIPDDIVPPEAEENFIVMVGNATTGQRVVGPFDSFEEAIVWAQDVIGIQELTWVTNIFHPNSRDARNA